MFMKQFRVFYIFTFDLKIDKLNICRLWELARQCVVRSIGAFTYKLECRDALGELDAFQSGIQERMDWICSGENPAILIIHSFQLI